VSNPAQNGKGAIRSDWFIRPEVHALNNVNSSVAPHSLASFLESD
jgi:hypothetical protein